MRILLLNQFFWPDSSATSQLLTDLARGLVGDGHDVYAISADGGYALVDVQDAPAVQMHRVKSLPFTRGRIGRVLSYASFYLFAAIRSITLPKPDLVITLTTPPLLSILGNIVQTLRGSRHFIWEMDLYPDVAIDLGYFKAGGLCERVTGLLADWSRHRADGIIALGECMKARLVKRGISAERIFVAHNWADSRAIVVLPRQGTPDSLNILYSGNLGLAHDLDTIKGAMLRLKEDTRFRFIFVGNGVRRDELTKFATVEGLDTVELRPYVQRATLSESLAIGDIGLVTQRQECCGSVVPSKVYGLLAAGRPILFIGPVEATPARIIKEFNCGWHVSCGDIKSLTKLLLHLAENPGEVWTTGQRAREALIEHFDRPLGVARIAGIVGAGLQVSPEKTYAAFPAEPAGQHSHVS
ncbi:glycosyltransferase family 4 protein [Granulicella sp. dw_53]|uniref:glycosyltransferase family 4 protein n=1 Tax=Granulicella sp. dw_53 TaxID=2719792 RepID=UPI001BD43BCA|nr:glycosyltransferase family 4 protein [Granulicella sp. dw_53]